MGNSIIMEKSKFVSEFKQNDREYVTVECVLYCTITNKHTTNIITVYITTVSLCNVHCYMFRHFPVTITQFTTNTLLTYTLQTSTIVTSTKVLYMQPQTHTECTTDRNS
jgi:hypothetical protein